MKDQMKTLNERTTILLGKEAALSSMNLGVGLTFMRKYDFTNLGFIYQSFFSLSVGLERLMKLILIYEYIYVNDEFPDFNYLRSKGHKLSDLLSEMRPLIEKYSCEQYFTLTDNDQIFKIIIDNLTDFATQSRYSNLNELSGNNSAIDPIRRWDQEVNSIILERHFNPDSPKNKKAMDLAKQLEDFTVVMHHDESDQFIDNYSALASASLTIPTKQKYGMYYAFCIVKAICHLQREQSNGSPTNISLDEYFMIFRTEYSEAKKLKTWNPHPPYRF